MQEFPSNSAKARARSEAQQKPGEQPEKIERVISGEAKQRRRGLGRQFKETFIAGSFRGAVDFVAMEVVVPAIQELLIESLQSGTERFIRGDSRPRRSYSSITQTNQPHVNYQGISTNRTPPTSRMLSRQARERHTFGEIVLSSRQDAEEVIDRMYDVLSRYGSVQVSTLYALTGIQATHADQKWGWTSLSGARAAKQRGGGYLLDLPEPESLDR